LAARQTPAERFGFAVFFSKRCALTKTTMKNAAVRPDTQVAACKPSPALPLRATVERIYKIYGRDLGAFYRDARTEIEKRK
jgi:hypothetical protein